MKGHHIPHLPANLPPWLRSRLRAFEQRVRWVGAAADLAGLLLVCAGLTTLFCAFDRLVDVPGAWRLPGLLLTGLSSAALAVRLLVRLVRPPDYDALAHQLDQAAGDSRGHLRSALDFCRRQLPEASFAGLTRERAQALWASRPVGPCVNCRPLRRVAAAVALAAVLAGLWQVEWLRAELLVRRFLDPLGNHMRPTATWFEVEALPDTPLHGGDDFTVRARLCGRPVANPAPLMRLTSGGATASAHRLQAGRDGTWELALRDVRAEFAFQLELGSARSAVYRVAVDPRPAVEQIHVTYQFPAYSRLPERQEILAGRTITALDGAKVKVELRCNIPLASATAMAETEQRNFTVDARDRRRAARYHFVSANERHDLLLRADNGLESRAEPPIHFRVVPDTPPVVILASDPGSRAFFPNEVISLAYRAQDDLGLAEVALIVPGSDFSQEAELEKYGARETAGTIHVPVSALVKPGVSAVQLRVTALDTKGQRSASPPVTLRIAANSYDRQLRAALRGFTATERSGSPDKVERLGFPALVRQAQKLTDLRTLNAKLIVLRELLTDGAQPGASEQGQVDEARRLTALGGPVFPFVVPYVILGHGSLRAIDVLGRAPMTRRLQQIVRDAICGAELAISPEALTASFEAALRSANPKAELATVQAFVTAAVDRQQQVMQVLDDNHRTLQLELAGYLASTLDVTLRRAGEFGLVDSDARGVALASLRELAALLAGPLLDLVDEASRTSLAQALQAPNEPDVLAQAGPLLAPIARRLTAAAAEVATRQPAARLPVHDYLRAVGPTPGPDWAATYALWLDIQMDDVDAEEESLHRHALVQLRYAATGTLDPGDVAVLPDARKLDLFATLARFAEQAAALRVGLATRQAIVGQPTFEPAWLRLRELAFELGHLSGAAPDAARLEAFSNTLVPLAGWLPDDPAVAGLLAALANWEAEARALALTLLPEARRRLQARVAAADHWTEDMALAIDRYREAVAEQIRILERTRDGEMAHRNLPAMGGRLNLLSCAVLKILDIREAAGLLGASTDLPDLDRLAALRVALKQAQEHLDKGVGSPINNVGSSALSKGEVELRAWKGKSGSWEEHSRLLADLRGLLALGPVNVEHLKRQVILHRYELERKAIGAALAVASAPATNAAALLASAANDRLAAPAFWGCLVDVAAGLRQAVAAGPRERVVERLAALQALAAQAGPLPREALSLGALPERGQAGLASEEAARDRFVAELDELLAELQPLTVPPAVFADSERRQQQQVAVWQERFRSGIATGSNDAGRVAIAWAVTDLEWNRRKQESASRQVGVGGLSAALEDELGTLKLPRHLYLELKRAREGAMPELYKERSHRYLSTIMEQAR